LLFYVSVFYASGLLKVLRFINSQLCTYKK
jgi:hypothetical protein